MCDDQSHSNAAVGLLVSGLSNRNNDPHERTGTPNTELNAIRATLTTSELEGCLINRINLAVALVGVGTTANETYDYDYPHYSSIC